MATIQAGKCVLAKLCEALGLDPKTTRRFVLDVPCDGVAKLYVERYADFDPVAAAAAVEGLEWGEAAAPPEVGPQELLSASDVNYASLFASLHPLGVPPQPPKRYGPGHTPDRGLPPAAGGER